MNYKFVFLVKGETTQYHYNVDANNSSEAYNKLRMMAKAKKLQISKVVSVVGWGCF